MKSNIPKVLHRICGREMMRLSVDAARGAGAAEVVAVVPPNATEVRSSLDSDVKCVEQAEPLGTGHALMQALPSLAHSRNVLVAYGDVPLVRSETLERMMAKHTATSAKITLLTSNTASPDGMGRVVRDESNSILAIVEEKDAGPDILNTRETNGGIYCMDSRWLMDVLPSMGPSADGEIYLTDLVGYAAGACLRIESVHPDFDWEVLGINDRVRLAAAESVLRQQIRLRWMNAGVTLTDPGSTYIDLGATIGEDTVIYPNTHLLGDTRIGRECAIGPNSIVKDSAVADRCRIASSVVEDAWLGHGISVGPFSHIRAGSRVDEDVHIGNFAEIKNSHLGKGVKMGHFSYIGDAVLGVNVNIGAGAVTCNFDGREKHRVVIGDHAFIGSDSMLVAPVSIGSGASTAAGAVVTKDVPPNNLAIGAPARNTPKRGEANGNNENQISRGCRE